MNWKKQGLILAPGFHTGFTSSRIMCPTPFLLETEILRIFCGFCDENGISRIGYVDVDPNNPKNILNISQKPILDIGNDGMFDDNGVVPTSVVKIEDKLLLYYFGFQKGVKIPFYMFSGLAISYDGGESFVRYQGTPILDRTDKEPLMRSGPFVLFDKIYKLWYPTGNEFINLNGKSVHTYVIKYLESKDGVNWGKEGTVVLAPKNEDEYGFGRPFVIKAEDKYHLYYSIRTRSLGYRLGFAESIDGINWIRLDEQMGINVSQHGWDSQMMCYSAIFKYKDKKYLFYNGNNLGDTGFGFAVMTERVVHG